MEIWKDIPGYENYQVSNLGRVKSLFYNKERILKPSINNNGYPNIVIRKNNKSKNFKVHQLVAIAFLNHIPNGLFEVIDHINGNKLDNTLENLRIVTSRENSVFAISKIKTSSIYTGVSWSKARNQWKTTIRINNKKINLGWFKCEIKASQAYEKALEEIIKNPLESLS
jgi:ribosomal protein L22